MNNTVPTTLAPHSKQPGTNMTKCNTSSMKINRKILIIIVMDKYSFSRQDHRCDEELLIYEVFVSVIMNTAFFWNNIFNSLVTGTNNVQECAAFIFMEGE
jgi:hypothetical protein